MIFGEIGHAHSAAPGISQNPAVADDRGGDAGIRRNLQGLQSATGHSCHRDLICIKLLMVLAGLVIVLRERPIYGVREEWRFRWTTGTAALTWRGHGANGDHDEPMGGDLG